MQILLCNKFYKIDIREFTENNETSTWSFITKIWHVSISKMSSSSPYFKCRIETFRRQQDDSTMQQSEKSLWNYLAIINDDVTLMLDQYGRSLEIINIAELQKKAHEAFANIRERYDGVLIDKLLNDVEFIYQDPSQLLFELNAYKQFGLLTLGLYSSDLKILVKDRTINLKDAFKIEVEEYYTRKDSETTIQYSMKGKVINTNEEFPKINGYEGVFSFEPEIYSIQKANVELSFTMPDHKKVRRYTLSELTDKDMEYI